MLRPASVLRSGYLLAGRPLSPPRIGGPASLIGSGSSRYELPALRSAPALCCGEHARGGPASGRGIDEQGGSVRRHEGGRPLPPPDVEADPKPDMIAKTRGPSL